MKLKFFTAKNLDELKRQYKDLIRQYHPDMSRRDTNAEMATINNEYEFLFAKLPKTQAEEAAGHNIDDMFREVINSIIHLELEIEICGSWIWVSGNTYPHKEALKANNFSWASKKKQWYWKPSEYRKKSKKVLSMDEIRNLYGSEKIAGKTFAAIAN